MQSPLQPATIQIQTRPQARPPPPPAHLLKKLSGKTHTPVLVSPKPYAFQSHVNYSQAEDHAMLAHPPRNNLATVQSAHGLVEAPSASSSPHVASPDWRSPVPLYHTQAAPSSTERVLPESFFTPVKEVGGRPTPAGGPARVGSWDAAQRLLRRPLVAAAPHHEPSTGIGQLENGVDL